MTPPLIAARGGFVNSYRFHDFCRFASAQLYSGDIDPVYPVLAHVYRADGVTREQALWRTLLYLTWYHLGSAKRAWEMYPSPARVDADRFISFPTGTERRGFRGNHKAAALFINQFVGGIAGDRLEAFVDGLGTGTAGWDKARIEMQRAKGAGPWAAYKWADLLKHVHGLPFEASDLGVGGNSETAGPIPGMVRLTRLDWKECALNVDIQRELLELCRDRGGVAFAGLDQLETALCDFNSLSKGGYYIGHDIDDLMTKLEAGACGPAFWEARAAVFPREYLGEQGQPGWFGVRKELKRVYVDEGALTYWPKGWR